MYHKILETDEVIEDIYRISCEAYNFTRDKDSGLTFFKLYDAATENMMIFPDGFSTTDIEYRGYVIHMVPFGNYNLFYTVNNENRRIYILRILYQKQNWQRILRVNNNYHVSGRRMIQ
jgi:plasmid stabilization system protein ParE